MTKTNTYITVLCILLFFSGVFSAIETAYSSANKIRLKNMMNDGNAEAAVVLKILSNYDRFLTAVLIGNNIVNIASATIGTLLFTIYFGEKNGPTISTAVITVIVLLFGEFTPKSIAKQIPEKFSCATAGFVQIVQFVLTPLSFVMSGWQKISSRIIKIEDEDSDIADELITMVDEAEKDGDLEEHESDLISAAIEFNDLDVSDVLTPRVDLVAVDISMTIDQVETIFRRNSFSRLPVYETSIDNIVGLIHEKDFYDLLYHNKGAALRKIIKPVIYTSPNTKISSLLKQLQSSKMHLAVVLDEYGGTDGIITMEDIIEELVGEIWDEHDTVKEYYTELDQDNWLVKCDAEIYDLFDRFEVDADDDDYDFITVSGWVIHELEHIPHVGEEFDFENLHVKVTKADQRKVIEVQVVIDRQSEDKGER